MSVVVARLRAWVRKLANWDETKRKAELWDRLIRSRVGVQFKTEDRGKKFEVDLKLWADGELTAEVGRPLR